VGRPHRFSALAAAFMCKWGACAAIVGLGGRSASGRDKQQMSATGHPPIESVGTSV
jgi:hypothetical protein